MNAAVSPETVISNETSTQRKRRPSRRVLTVLAILGVVGGGYYGHDWYVTGRFMVSADNAYLRADQVSMAPAVSGQIIEVYVRDNQEVAAGQALVKIDPRRYEMAVHEAAATLNARKADLARSEAELQQQTSVIAQSQADLENATENADLAQKDYNRASPLVARGIESQQKVEQARSKLEQAKSIIRLKQAAFETARQQTVTLQAQIDLARAQFDAAQESLGKAEIDLEDTVLRSSITGRIGDRTVQKGQFVQPGTLLMTVVPTNNIYLVANFKETQIGNMREGQRADLRIDAYPNTTVTGVVRSFAPGTGAQFALLPPENATGNFTKIVQRVPVRIELEAQSKDAPPLVPGLSVEVTVDTRTAAADRTASSR